MGVVACFGGAVAKLNALRKGDCSRRTVNTQNRKETATCFSFLCAVAPNAFVVLQTPRASRRLGACWLGSIGDEKACQHRL